MEIIVREIRNNAGSNTRVASLAYPAETDGGSLEFVPGERRETWIHVPVCEDNARFDQGHIKVHFADGRHFSVWQASHDWESRVRVSEDGQWHERGTVIGGFAAEGPIEEQFLNRTRALVINDFALWLLPYLVTQTLDNVAARVREEGYKICGEPVDSRIDSIPKKSSIAFSMPAIPSDAFDRGQPGARFLYRDSGKRYEFQIKDGVVHFQPSVVVGGTPVSKLDMAVSYTRKRAGVAYPAPQFDLIAANGGRVFAKEKGWDRFYFALLDRPYIHAGADGKELEVSSNYYKLDPEFNQVEANPQDLITPLSTGFVETHAFGEHPAAERYPLFRLLCWYGVIELMAVRIRRLTWHLIDARPPVIEPRVHLAKSIDPSLYFASMIVPRLEKAISEDLPPGEMPSTVQKAPPPSWVTSYDHVQYCPNEPRTAVWQKSIKYHRVLDIGVGHVPHHEQSQGITGGELQPLQTPVTLADYWQDAAQPYRFMNGPVRDDDGYIDGTCNYYLLVQLKDDADVRSAEQNTLVRKDAYGLLYLEEQSFFTQRWHLAHPEDWRGAMWSMVERLHGDMVDRRNGYPDRHRWQPELYWCPFRTGHIGPRSRLAVAAQVVLVTGEHPDSKEPLLYSTNFSFVSMDRTWRWRALPAPARYSDGQSVWTPSVSTVTGDEQVPDGPDACVYPQTIRIRDDMTICLQGRGPGRDGRIEVGRWYQRYLPTTNEVVPPVEDPREESVMPKSGYSHPWKFLPEAVFRLADQFRHFGVYDVVDSRAQFYIVTPASPADAAALAAGQSGAWVDVSKTIAVEGYSFRFNWMRLPWPSLASGWTLDGLGRLFAGLVGLIIGRIWPDLLSAADRDTHPSIPPLPTQRVSASLFNPETRLRIVQRGPQWIAMHWDKRDEDLMPFLDLGTPVTLEYREGPDLNKVGGQVTVRLSKNHWVKQPPAARVAYFNWGSPGPSGEARALVGFVTARPQGELSNVWRVRIAALDPARPGGVVGLLDVVTTPDKFAATFDGSFHEHHWTPAPGQLAELQQYCSPAGAIKYGTSIWFEDAVGHVSVPEEVLWLRKPVPMELVLEREIKVPESAANVDTGIDLRPGDDYAFEARGSISAAFLFPSNGPEGQSKVDLDPKFPLSYGPDARPFCLIGRFGTNPWFYVGVGRPRGKYAHTVPHRLFLRTNDDTPGGGSGEFFCRVRVWRAPAVPPPVRPHFDVRFYLGHYDDLRNAFGTNYAAAVDHWLNQGLPKEGRRGSREFDVRFYLEHYGDLKNAFGADYAAALSHWLNQGLPKEGRRGSREFDVGFYLERYGDLRNAFGTNYAAAVDHWLNQGLPKEGRRGSQEFDVQYYLATYADLQAAFGNNYSAALDHWVKFGIPEGRKGAPQIVNQVDAEFVTQDVPDTMLVGQRYPVSITMRNTGTTTWTSAGPNPYRLGSQNPQDNTLWGFNRRDLPGPIAPGQPVTFRFDVTPPRRGIRNFQWRMLEGAQWFGASSTNVAVQVEDPSL